MSRDATTTPSRPLPGRAGIKDAAAPRLARASVKRAAGGARVRFWLSEPATVEITLRAREAHGRAGDRAGPRRHARRAPAHASLKKGTYTVELRAVDAMGNRAPAATKSVKVK